MDYESLLELVKKRRSIRRFKPEPIPDEYIDKIIEAARWAPSGFNTQPWEFVIVRDKVLKDNIVKIIDEYRINQFDRMELSREKWQGKPWRRWPKDPMDYSNAPVFILLLGDTRTKVGLPMSAWYNINKRESIFDSSLASTFLYMHLTATALGLASQWTTAVQVPVVSCLLKEVLGIPRHFVTYDMMVLGYPALTPKQKFLRDKKEIVHYDYCGEDDFRTEEEVKDFIRRTRNWALSAPHHRQTEQE